MNRDSDQGEAANTTALEARFAKLRPIIPRPSGDAESALWRELMRLTGDEAARDLVLEPRGLEQDDLRRAWIRRCVRMADGMYQSFYDSDETIDPILLYYGNMWLAKALIYASALPELLSGDWDRHGIVGDRAATVLPLVDRSIKVAGKGIIPTLCDALGGSDIRNKVIPIEHLLRAVPDISAVLEDTKGWETIHQRVSFDERFDFGPKSPATVRVLYGLDNGGLIARGTEAFDEVVILASLYRKLPDFYVAEARQGVGELRWSSWGLGEHAFEMYSIAGRGDRFIECRLPGGSAVPELVVMLIFQHALSEYARYEADTWLNAADEHTPEYAIIRDFVDASYRKFPLLVLNELTFRNYKFESKS